MTSKIKDSNYTRNWSKQKNDLKFSELELYVKVFCLQLLGCIQQRWGDETGAVRMLLKASGRKPKS